MVSMQETSATETHGNTVLTDEACTEVRPFRADCGDM